MELGRITPLIITYNEGPNLRRCLEGLAWAKRIVVVDSGSTDETLSVCAEHAAVEVVTRGFDTFAAQCNFGLSQVHTEWVLSLDADYMAGAEFGEALRVAEETGVDGWRVDFTYCIHGKPVRCGLYPPRVVLYRVAKGRYQADGHGHKVAVQGVVRDFPVRLLHDDRKPLGRWLSNQLRYAAEEAEKLSVADAATLPKQDKLRLTGWAAPFAMLLYCLIWRGGWRDGWAGWRYAAERMFAELLLCLHLLERRLAAKRRES
jgi:glycosyltransferase involved in cell wall biosynthesis